MTTARSELILGGQKSGKSRRAENLAQDWITQSPAHSAWLLATGQAYDAEMAARIARHQSDRAARVPGLATIEVPLDLASALRERSRPDCLLVIDCLTMWLTNWMMPMTDHLPGAQRWAEQADAFIDALAHAPGPVVIVGNEIGLGVIPLGGEVRAFVDALGVLNQRVAAACSHATLMCAGLPLVLKGEK